MRVVGRRVIENLSQDYLPTKSTIRLLNVFMLVFYSANIRPKAGYRPPPPRGNFVHYDFLKLQYISHKMRHVSPLRVEALSCNNNITYVIL